MPDLKEHIDRKNLPSHIAIIMDGNGRWARKQGILRVFGHKNAITAVRETIEGAAEIGIQYVTLFAFSTENWQRPAHEVMALMELLVATLRKELPTLMKNNIRLRAIGNTDELPKDCRENLAAAIQATEKNTHTILTLALSYGGRGDIVAAARKIAEQAVAGTGGVHVAGLPPARSLENGRRLRTGRAGAREPVHADLRTVERHDVVIGG